MSGCRLLFVLQTFRPIQIKKQRTADLSVASQLLSDPRHSTRNRTPPLVPFAVQGSGPTTTTT